jgi:hypothetical protein
MALIAAQNISEEGIVPVLVGASEGDTFENSGSSFVMIDNRSASSVTVSVVAQLTTIEIAQYGEVTKENASVVVSANSTGFFGPFPNASFNDDNGIAFLTYSATETLSVAILTVGN